MNEVAIIGLDLAKNVFQIHGAGPDGRIAFRKKLNRGRLLEFFAKLPICVVAMEASTVVRWARRHGAPTGSWLARMLLKKPPKLIAVALASKLARIAWALMARGGAYQAPASGSV